MVDIFTRECLWIEVGSSMSGRRVTEVLDFLIHLRGTPKVITTDNGSEFAGRTLDKWAYDHRVLLHFIDPGKPVQNAYIESFNGKFRNECLNDHWFHSVEYGIDSSSYCPFDGGRSPSLMVFYLMRLSS